MEALVLIHMVSPGTCIISHELKVEILFLPLLIIVYALCQHVVICILKLILTKRLKYNITKTVVKFHLDMNIYFPFFYPLI